MKDKLITITRWIAVLPASIMGAFVGNALVWINNNIFKWFNGEAPNTISLTDIIGVVCANIIVGFAFVYMGVLTAPKYKEATAIILTVIFSIITTISVVLELNTHGASKTFYGCIIGLIASIGTCIKVCYTKDE